MLFPHECSSIFNVNDMKLTVQDFGFPGLILELGSKESFKRLIELVSDGN